jgi:hypothetical protein
MYQQLWGYANEKGRISLVYTMAEVGKRQLVTVEAGLRL